MVSDGLSERKMSFSTRAGISSPKEPRPGAAKEIWRSRRGCLGTQVTCQSSEEQGVRSRKEEFGQLQTCRVDDIRTYGDANEDVESTLGGSVWPFITNPSKGEFHFLVGLRSVIAIGNVISVSLEIRIVLRMQKGSGISSSMAPSVSTCSS